MMRRAVRYLLALFVSATTLLSASCNAGSSGDSADLTPIVVQLRWLHQAQFAGFYAADQNGYYADEGLDVSFIQGGPDVAPLDTVLDGTADFGVTDSSVLILARAEETPVRAIAAIYRRSPIVFFSPVESDIVSPEDFVGKTIGLGRHGVPTLHAMMANIGVPSDQYTVFIGNDLDLLINGEIDVIGGYVINEALRAREEGLDLNFISPDDYGVHSYADCLFARDDFLDLNPELTTRFLRATLQGWSYAIEHSDMAGDLVRAYDPETDVQHQHDMLVASIPLVDTGEDEIGWMQDETWREMAEMLRAQDILTRSLDIDDVYTMTFLDQVFSDP